MSEYEVFSIVIDIFSCYAALIGAMAAILAVFHNNSRRK